MRASWKSPWSRPFSSGTQGEWSETMREVFGAYRGPTGVSGAAPAADREQLEAIRARVLPDG